ncbi:beta-3-deoxy-D-manno-oct-2-ulosonic acid transferase [Sphingomonas sp. PB2P12]|uniref:capsular polysaccharide export protein, LipB/KpsS family n=1 Tax=Sphingomonas sandaracina TaxID=3096157 RepID=UPI002FC5A374
MTDPGSIPGVEPVTVPVIEDAEIERVFAAIRDARVGGPFWERPVAASNARTIVRAWSASEIADLRAGTADAEQDTVLWLLPAGLAGDPAFSAPRLRGAVVFGEVDPWSLLKEDVQLFAHGGDEWVALADIVGCRVRVLSDGTYGTLDTTPHERRQRIANAVFGIRYRDPPTGLAAGVDATIAHLGFWRRICEGNRDIGAACGIAWWKRREIARFLWQPDRRLRFFSSEHRAIAHARRQGGAVAVWPSRISPAMVRDAAAAGVPLVRVEDGFVRSVGLGSDMVPPSSITIDWRGIHYDPSRASDLETLLAETQFPPALLARAVQLRAAILAGGISKYGGSAQHVFPAREPGRRLVLVPGQVEDDMSVKLGGGGLASNLELLRRARALEPEAEIWFRPHPDVDAGHRKGAVPDADALQVADRIVRGGGMAALLERVDAVHVLTSLTGFEALLRGCDVTCHGMPFYAGWGLTRDLMPLSDRRGRGLKLDELVAGVLILYPRYLDPVSGLPCEPETLFARMVAGDAVNRLGWVTRLRQIQGRMMKGRR